MKESVSNTRKNMCDLRKDVDRITDERGGKLLAYLEDTIRNKNNNNVSRSHILLDIEKEKETEKRKKKGSSAERTEKNGRSSISNTYSKPYPPISNTISNKLSISNKTAEKLDIERCPCCGKHGSLQQRYVLNSVKKRYGPYYYFEHYEEGKVQWCYIGRGLPDKKNEREDTQAAEENKR